MSASAAPLDLVALSGEIARRVGVKAERDAPLARFTTMRVGGTADLLATAHNAFELRALGRPGAADAVAALVRAAATRQPLPETAEIDRLARGTAA